MTTTRELLEKILQHLTYPHLYGDKYELRADIEDHLARPEPEPVVPEGVITAANALLHQIDIGTFFDEHGHSAKMLKATHDLMKSLDAAPQPEKL